MAVRHQSVNNHDIVVESVTISRSLGRAFRVTLWHSFQADERMGAGFSVLSLDALGNRIKSRRLRLGITQGDLAGDGLTKSFVSQIENGAATPSLATLIHLASRLDISLGELLDGSVAKVPIEAAVGSLSSEIRTRISEDNLRAHLLVELAHVTYTLGHASCAQDLLSFVDDPKSGNLPGWLRAEALYVYGSCCEQLGEHARATKAFKQSALILGAKRSTEEDCRQSV